MLTHTHINGIEMCFGFFYLSKFLVASIRKKIIIWNRWEWLTRNRSCAAFVSQESKLRWFGNQSALIHEKMTNYAMRLIELLLHVVFSLYVGVCARAGNIVDVCKWDEALFLQIGGRVFVLIVIADWKQFCIFCCVFVSFSLARSSIGVMHLDCLRLPESSWTFCVTSRQSAASNSCVTRCTKHCLWQQHNINKW